MTTISNLPHNLLEEILSRVPMTCLRAMRSTCKLWNKLLKDPLSMHFAKASKEIMFISTYTHRACLMSNNDLVDPFIKQIGELKEVEIHKVFHCTGLLLCLNYANPDDHKHSNVRLLVWNPYSGSHTSWIEPRRTGRNVSMRHFFSMGYDNNNCLKIMKFSQWHMYNVCDIYDFKSRSWRVLGTEWNIYDDGVSLKGDSYFIAYRRTREEPSPIICFDFTREKFWDLPQPCDSESSDLKVALSVVSEEKLAVLSIKNLTMKIWITNKIEKNAAVSWSCYLKFDCIHSHRFCIIPGTFFINEKKKVAMIYEKKKVAMICDLDPTTRNHYKASMVGKGGGVYREMEEVRGLKSRRLSLKCSPYFPYVPSLMQIQ